MDDIHGPIVAGLGFDTQFSCLQPDTYACTAKDQAQRQVRQSRRDGGKDAQALTPVTPVVVGNVSFTGTVSEVSGREFTINTGARELTVDTVQMPYNPMDEEGLQKVEVGDVVSVAGNLGTDVIGDRELTADSVVIIQDDSST